MYLQSYRCVSCSDYCYSINFTATLQNTNLMMLQVCYNFKPPNQDTFCYTGCFIPTVSCKYTVDGVDCNSCHNNSFDCTNIPNGLSSKGNNYYPLRILQVFKQTNTNAGCAPGSTPTSMVHWPTSTTAPSSTAKSGTSVWPVQNRHGMDLWSWKSWFDD